MLQGVVDSNSVSLVRETRLGYSGTRVRSIASASDGENNHIQSKQAIKLYLKKMNGVLTSCRMSHQGKLLARSMAGEVPHQGAEFTTVPI